MNCASAALSVIAILSNSQVKQVLDVGVIKYINLAMSFNPDRNLS